ncbi:hypothetical protein HNP40_000697 [Mycobacteroides chelonae]|nr:hypothetical protein [Mycobacteroides chelonae]
MADFTRLSRDWNTWSSWFGMSNVSVSVENDHEACFKSDDETFCLRTEGEWWVVDSINDRGKKYEAIGSFSSFELAEKYLISRWAFTVTGASELGPELYARGMNPDVAVRPTDDEWRVELESGVGNVRLSTPEATIFSHLMLTPTDQIERRADHTVSQAR